MKFTIEIEKEEDGRFIAEVIDFLGVLGFTTTTVVALPVAGIVATARLAAYGVKKVFFD